MPVLISVPSFQSLEIYLNPDSVLHNIERALLLLSSINLISFPSIYFSMDQIKSLKWIEPCAFFATKIYFQLYPSLNQPLLFNNCEIVNHTVFSSAFFSVLFTSKYNKMVKEEKFQSKQIWFDCWLYHLILCNLE